MSRRRILLVRNGRGRAKRKNRLTFCQPDRKPVCRFADVRMMRGERALHGGFDRFLQATQAKMNADPTVQATMIEVSGSPMTGSSGATRT